MALLNQTTTDAGTVDAAASADGRALCVQTGANGIVDEYHVNTDGSLTQIGSVTVANADGGEGIVASSINHAPGDTRRAVIPERCALMIA